MAIPSRIIREMISEVIEFTRTYAVWQELMQPAKANVRGAHQDFLLTVTNALVLSFCVGVYQLFDRNSQTKSLIRLIEDIRPSDSVLAQKLTARITADKSVIQRVSRLRNTVYAHRNKFQHPQDVFAAVKLTPRMMKSLVQLAQEVVAYLAVAVGTDTKKDLETEFRRHEDYVLSDTREVLHALEKSGR
jgi:hypothetical protein